VGDIPGAIVPSLYFSYLQSGDARTLDPILKHNKWDILSMASLLFKLVEDLHDPQTIKEPLRMLQLGKLFAKRGDLHRAKGLVNLLLEENIDGEILLSSLQLGIEVLKKTREHHLLYPLLYTLTSQFPDDAYGWIERAKYEEHRLKDYEAALLSSQKALSVDATLSQRESKRIDRLARRVNSRKLPLSKPGTEVSLSA
jgi:hypothetical protein